GPSVHRPQDPGRPRLGHAGHPQAQIDLRRGREARRAHPQPEADAMTDLRNQRRMAAAILKCGRDRVWIDPDQIEDVASAVTRSDVRRLISSGSVVKLAARGVSRGRARVRDEDRKQGRRRGPGSRKGAKGARKPRKATWMNTIRALRDVLHTLRDEKKI